MIWRVPSLAIGTVQCQARQEPVVWGLAGALARAGLQVQALASQAIPDPRAAIVKLTGRPLKHLDSWVQDRRETLSALYRGAGDSQAAVIYGSLAGCQDAGGDFATLCQRLSLPRIAIVDVSQLDPCRIPPRPAQVAGILLDRACGARSRIQWQTMLETLWDAPLLGWLDESPARTLIDYLPLNQTPSCDCLEQLVQSLSATLDFERLLGIAQRAPWHRLPGGEVSDVSNSPVLRRMCVRIAVAHDEAFPCYSADTLELLEAAGACVQDFSPLRCERIPAGTDVVLLGTGTSDQFWPDLARNCCLQQSLRSFAAAGGRVYAEGSGLAYLSRQVVLADQQPIPMSGLVPVIARRDRSSEAYEPAQLTTAMASWLFGKGQELRGYRQIDWEIEPVGPMSRHAPESPSNLDLLGRGNVIGSRVVLHFASHPALLRRFLSPFAPLVPLAPVSR